MLKQSLNSERRIVFFDVVETVFSLTPLEDKMAEFNLPAGTDRLFSPSC